MERGICMTCNGKVYSENIHSTVVHTHHRPGCPRPPEICDGSCGEKFPDPLQHLVLSWAARSLLTMTEGWRDRQMLMLGKPVNEATDEAANALHEQGFLANFPGTVISHGGIVLTDAGRDQLAEWDRLAAGVQ